MSHRSLERLFYRLWFVLLGLLLVGGLAGPAGFARTANGPENVHATGYSDIGEAGSHRGAIEAWEKEGLFKGTECGPGLFCPNDPVQRWVMAVWLVRILDGGDPVTAAGSRFVDVEQGEWWAEHVERLAALGITKGCALNPGLFCPDGAVTRAQMASFVKRAFGLEDAPSAGFVDTGGNTHEESIDSLFASGVTVGCFVDPLRYCPDRPVSRGEMATFLLRVPGLGTAVQAPAGRLSFTRDGYSEIVVMDANGGNQRPLSQRVSSKDPAWSPDSTRVVFSSQSYAFFRSSIFVANSDGSGLRQLTRDHIDGSPVWSPDGTRIAFTSDRRIFVMDADGGNLQQITQDSSTSMAWSPDSSRIAYVGLQDDNYRDQEVFVVDADGRSQRQLTDLDSREVKDLQWSSDNTRLVFSQYESGSGSGDIYVVDANSGGLTQLTRRADDVGPVWSPDGTRVAFQSDRAGGGNTFEVEIFIIDADGGNLRQLTHSSALQASDNRYFSRHPVWSPDGDSIAFQSDRDGDLDIFTVEVDTGTLTQLTHNDSLDYAPVWSPDSTSVAFHGVPGGEQDDVEIFVADVNTGSLAQLTDNQYADIGPMWSPNSRHIVFTRSHPSQIFLVDADGSNLAQLTHHDSRPVNINNYRHTEPVWSPDGSLIAYTRPSEFFVQIFVVDPDDPSPRQLTSDIYDRQELFWSPDSYQLAYFQYTGDSPNPEIFLVDVATATPRQLTTDNYGHRYAAWSPDGSRIAYVGRVDDRDQIVTLHADRSNPRQLTREGGYRPMWSPDGSRIAFQGDSGIYVVDADGSNMKKVTGTITYPSGPAWSPDSLRIAFLGPASIRGWPDHNVFVVDADGGNLRQLTNNNRDTFGAWCLAATTRLDTYPYLRLSCDTPGDYWGGDPVWSPDGTRIAYTLPVEGIIEVFVMEADGSNLVQLTDNAGREYPKGYVPGSREPIPRPLWSPDGSQIAFVSDRDGDYEVFVVNSDGTNLIQITDNHYHDRNPAWSPAG